MAAFQNKSSFFFLLLYCIVLLTVQPDSQISDLTDPLLLLRNRRPDELLKLPMEDRDDFCAATLGGKPPNASDGRTRILTPELILLMHHVIYLNSCIYCGFNRLQTSNNVRNNHIRTVTDHLLHGLLQFAGHVQRFSVFTDTLLERSHLSLQLVDGVPQLPDNASILDL